MLANSVKLALPRITAPARRSNSTTLASRFACASARASEPAVVCWASAEAILSLTSIGVAAMGGLVAVECGGDRQRVGVYLAHRVEARPGAVISLDARKIRTHQLGGS